MRLGGRRSFFDLSTRQMPFCLEHVVPWGRSLIEYQRMFALTDEDLRLSILGCADGPASFNADASALGANVVSADPIYSFRQIEIKARIQAIYPEMMQQIRQNHSEFVWAQIGSVEELGHLRMKAMQRFLDDYETGRKCGRYLVAELPLLPFEDRAFDLALCSHFLFLYSSQFNLEFHINSIFELCRVAKEVRIFPLLGLGSVPSHHVAPVMTSLRRTGLGVSIETVNYEFQKGGNQMMRITTC